MCVCIYIYVYIYIHIKPTMPNWLNPIACSFDIPFLNSEIISPKFLEKMLIFPSDCRFVYVDTFKNKRALALWLLMCILTEEKILKSHAHHTRYFSGGNNLRFTGPVLGLVLMTWHFKSSFIVFKSSIFGGELNQSNWGKEHTHTHTHTQNGFISRRRVFKLN